MGWIKRLMGDDEAKAAPASHEVHQTSHEHAAVPHQAAPHEHTAAGTPKPTTAKASTSKAAGAKPAAAAHTHPTAEAAHEHTAAGASHGHPAAEAGHAHATGETAHSRATAATTHAHPAAEVPHARTAAETHTHPAPAAVHAHPAPVAALPHVHAPTVRAGGVTVAHDQAMTLHLLTHIPDHAPREDDPHYHLFEQAKARLKRQGLWKCAIGDDLCDGEPELHHTYIEFSQINDVDPKKIQQALGLHFANDEQFQEWAESPGNLEVLCLPGDAPVLMADGSSRAIEDVRVGDRVVGHDMRSHPVTTVSVSEFVGSLVVIDGHRMTGNHPVLTARGWLPAVDVRPGDMLCFAAGSGEPGLRDSEVVHTAGAGPEPLRPLADARDGRAARVATAVMEPATERPATERGATFGGAFPATRQAPLGEFRGYTVFVAATHADPHDRGVATPYERRWRPARHIAHVPFEGNVYDIEVAGAESFVSAGLVVHNCANHHRAHYGIHVIPGPLWEALRFRRRGSEAAAEFVPANEE